MPDATSPQEAWTPQECEDYAAAQLAQGQKREDVIRGLVRAGMTAPVAMQLVTHLQQTGPTVPPSMPPPPAEQPVPPARRPMRQEPQGNWLDSQAENYSDAMIWLHLVLCQVPGLIIGLLFLLGCRTDDGKEIGKRVLTYSIAGVVAAVIFLFMRRFWSG